MSEPIYDPAFVSECRGRYLKADFAGLSAVDSYCLIETAERLITWKLYSDAALAAKDERIRELEAGISFTTDELETIDDALKLFCQSSSCGCGNYELAEKIAAELRVRNADTRGACE